MKHQTSTCQLNSGVLLNNIKTKPKGHIQNKNTTFYFSMQQTWTSVSSSVKNSLSLLWAHRTIGLNTAAILNTPLPATCRIITRGVCADQEGGFRGLRVCRERERESRRVERGRTLNGHNGAKLGRYQHYSLSWFALLLLNHLRIKGSRLHLTKAVNLPLK